MWVWRSDLYPPRTNPFDKQKMANISFLDLMLAEALAAGLARERTQADRPPPDNFFVLPDDLRAWHQIKDASKKENMVVALEITRKGNDACSKVQRIYMDMAREFENIPFLRVVIEPIFATFDELRKEVGGVQFTPTILVLFFDADDTIARAKYEGFDQIMAGIRSGRIEGVIKELLNRRAKLKMMEGLIAQHLRNQLSDKERRVREEYEKGFIRKMEEKNKEEERKKEQEEAERKTNEERERKKKENEEEELRKRKEREVREAEEKLREERPKHIQELLSMDVESASAGQLKKMMRNLGISSTGCVEKQDLRKKLVDSVPELRIKVGSKTQPSSSSPPSNYRTFEANNDGEVDKLRRELARTKDQLEQADRKLRDFQQENKDLKSKVKTSQLVSSSNSGSGKDLLTKKLEEELLVTRMLYTTTLEQFEELAVIHEPSGNENTDSLILRVRCTKHGIPRREKVYAMKVLSNYFKSQTQTQVRQDYQNEYEGLCRLPSHENIIHMWAFFFDRCDPTFMKSLRKISRDNTRTMSLFILMDEHPINMADYMKTLVGSRGPSPHKVLQWIKDLLKGLVFLYDHKVVHRDLKMANLLKNENGSLVISDFGKSLILDEDCDDFSVRHSAGMDIGGNKAHLAPEIIISRPGGKRYLNYSKQPVWAAGVLAYELAGHKNPFHDLAFSQSSYSIRDVPPLRKTYCLQSRYCDGLPAKLTDLVRTMLDPDPDGRLPLQRCLNMVETLC